MKIFKILDFQAARHTILLQTMCFNDTLIYPKSNQYRGKLSLNDLYL